MMSFCVSMLVRLSFFFGDEGDEGGEGVVFSVLVAATGEVIGGGDECCFLRHLVL